MPFNSGYVDRYDKWNLLHITDSNTPCLTSPALLYDLILM